MRLDLFESLPSRRFGCRASTTNSAAKSRSTSLYNAGTSSRGGCIALQLYSALHLYSSTALYTLHPLHPPSGAGQVFAEFQDEVRQSKNKIHLGWARIGVVCRWGPNADPLLIFFFLIFLNRCAAKLADYGSPYLVPTSCVVLSPRSHKRWYNWASVARKERDDAEMSIFFCYGRAFLRERDF